MQGLPNVVLVSGVAVIVTGWLERPFICQTELHLEPAFTSIIAIDQLTFGVRISTLISEGSYVPQKPTRPTQTSQNVQGDFGKFTNFMKRIVAVPHSEIKAKLDAEKRAKARKPKKTSARGSSDQED